MCFKPLGCLYVTEDVYETENTNNWYFYSHVLLFVFQ